MFFASNPNRSLFERLARGSVVTIGGYDGIHLGHQALLDRVTELASDSGLPAVVMSFEPTPKEYFSAGAPPPRLMHFREKFDALAARGIEIFYCPRFDAAMSRLAADAFIRRLLIHTLNTRHLVIGDDFRFAAGREGDIDMLRRAGRALGFGVDRIGSVVVDGERVSSTAIRKALQAGELDRARSLLGGYYCMSGKVVSGERIGRKLGYPTANVQLRRRQSPVMGIFAVRVRGLAEGPLDAVASVGTRPTFMGTKPLLEVHIFDFDEDIYGRRIQVEFVARLRDEEKFDDVQALVEQMHRDSAAAREILAA